MIERLLRWLGWNPCGKRVRLIVSESLDAAVIGTDLRGTLTRVLSKEFLPGVSGRARQSAIVELDAPVRYMGHRFATVLVVPRHRNFGIYSLLFTTIAVYVVPLADADAADDAQWDDVLAIWSLTRG